VERHPLCDDEREVIKELLKSNNGYETACTFPARYEFIKSNFNDIPVYDLQSCKELNSYLDSFPKDKLSIVFTSEYTNNPSSAFGHIMLLFSKDNTPLEIGDVVHFAAKTSTDDNFLKYSYKGMTGQYNGYLNFLQQRILKLDLVPLINNMMEIIFIKMIYIHLTNIKIIYLL
jgi:hypothetical protein